MKTMGESRPSTQVREREDGSSDGPSDQPPDPGPDQRTSGVVVLLDDAARSLDDDGALWLRDALTRAAREAVALESVEADGHEVRVRIVDDAEMSSLHGAHAGDPTTTDVLTFDLRDEPAGPLDVDIVVCADEAQRQGAARKRGAETELLLYALHGVLHCLGHDDHDDDAYARMHAREDEVLARIGVGALFGERASGEAPA